MATKEDVVRVVDEFINDNGLWQEFKEFVERQGYTVKELGFKDDE